MLLTTTVKTKWNSKTKLYYENLGYVYTGMKTDLEINVFDLPKGSIVNVELQCDYCEEIFYRRWNYYIKTHELIEKDSCKKCYSLKAKDGNFIKYGVSNVMQVDEIKKSQKESVLNKYGVENIFMDNTTKAKIKNVLLEKYGVSSYTKTPEYREKTRKTSLERYGKTSWMKTDEAKEMFSGENSPVWKGGVHDERWDRLQPEYKKWRFLIFSRDNFICQHCNIHAEYLEAHHILNWNDHPEYRYDENNGITFCQNCHIEFHRIYGKRNNSFEQLEEFLKR